ncbi:MAG: type II toxin-antitoxin system VapC family toxin [Myxococcaceae bacterium]|nr:type II toxin-antitoxin system VapC family toxin [Myxococcaceae bacterium]
MRDAVLWDSSAILALIDASDRNHALAVKAARGPLRKLRPFITNYVEVEAHALLLTRVGRVVARQWLTQGGLHVVRADGDEEQAARQLLILHADKDWSLCDAISFAVVEARGARGAFSFDRHFRERGRFEVFGLTR